MVNYVVVGSINKPREFKILLFKTTVQSTIHPIVNVLIELKMMFIEALKLVKLLMMDVGSLHVPTHNHICKQLK